MATVEDGLEHATPAQETRDLSKSSTEEILQAVSAPGTGTNSVEDGLALDDSAKSPTTKYGLSPEEIEEGQRFKEQLVRDPDFQARHQAIANEGERIETAQAELAARNFQDTWSNAENEQVEIAAALRLKRESPAIFEQEMDRLDAEQAEQLDIEALESIADGDATYGDYGLLDMDTFRQKVELGEVSSALANTIAKENELARRMSVSHVQAQEAAATAHFQAVGTKSNIAATERLLDINELARQSGIDLDALNPSEYREHIAALDSWITEAQRVNRTNGFHEALLDTETTSVSDGLRAGEDETARLLRKITGDGDAARRLDPARVEARTARSLQRKPLNAKQFTEAIANEGDARDVQSGFEFVTPDGRQLSGSDALYEASGEKAETERRQRAEREIIGGSLGSRR